MSTVLVIGAGGVTEKEIEGGAERKGGAAGRTRCRHELRQRGSARVVVGGRPADSIFFAATDRPSYSCTGFGYFAW